MAVYQSETGKWYMTLMIRGRRYHKAISEATCKKDAEKAETVFKSELLQGRYNLADNIGEMLFKKLLEVYKEYTKNNNLSWKGNISRLKSIEEFFGAKKLNEITPFLIEKYRQKRKKSITPRGKIISNTSINREIEILRKMLNIAIDNEWLDKNPASSKKVKKLREENKKERYLTVDEEIRLLKECSDHLEYLKPIVICALQTGMRKGEILGLTWSNVDFKKGFITLLVTKSGKARKIPISSVLMPVLTKLHKERCSKFVFSNPDTARPFYDLKRGFPAICRRANINDLTFHDLRHTAATRMVAAGIDLIVVQEILGHANITTTMRYAHPVPERKLAAVEALANFGKENNVIPFDAKRIETN